MTPLGPRLRSLVTFLALSAVPAAAAAQGPRAAAAPQQTAAVSAAIPHPAEVFGFEPGADYKLADYSQMLEYFRRLDAATDRVKVVEIGETVLGRPMILAIISSEENMRQLDRWRSISARLARARDLGEEEARRLAREGKAVVWIDGGLHSTETAGAQHSPLLAYKVAAEETPEMRRIRDEVVLLLMPVMNPDGLDIVVDWYEQNLGTAFEKAPLPWLYHHYVGHDNNRDWYMMTQPETRAVARVLYEEWYPQIVYNQHQPAPFPARIFIPPFTDPMNPNIPARVTSGVNLVGSAMSERFSREGKPGVVSRQTFSMWWNGGMRTVPYFHNMIGILTETANNGYATPRYEDPERLPKAFRGSTMRADIPSVFYPDPWEGGWWRIGDAVDYMITGDMAVLDIAAKRREEWLYGIYAMGRTAIELGEAGDPYAYVIPADEQWDAGEATNLVNVLRRGGVEVHRATDDFEVGGREYPEGSYIVYAAQAFRPYVLDLLEKQVYPEQRQYPGGPPKIPYDMAGWTLPIQMGVNVERIDAPFDAEVAAVDRATVRPGRIAGDGRFYLLSHRPNAAARAVNRLLAAGVAVHWAGRAFEAAGAAYPAGTIVVEAGRRGRSQVEALAREFGLDFVGVDETPEAPLHRLQLPRVALYKSWVANMDEGWTRWLLERYGFPVDTLHDADIRAGDLAGYDAIILPDQSAERILNGHAPGTMPAEYVGGLGVEGAAALKRYVERGGTVVALDGASDFAIEQFGLPVRNATAGVPSERFFIPGSLIRLKVDTRHPLAYGMPEEGAAFFVRSRAFELLEPADEGGKIAPAPRVDVIARYAEDDLLLSGWALGEERYLAGKPAVVRAELGEGDVVLIGFRAQLRGQPRNTFKLLFNPLHGATLDDLPRPEEIAAAAGGSR